MGIKTFKLLVNEMACFSEKPPHHMGIKTLRPLCLHAEQLSLKNLPTTWGLRHEFWVVFRQLQAL